MGIVATSNIVGINIDDVELPFCEFGALTRPAVFFAYLPVFLTVSVSCVAVSAYTLRKIRKVHVDFAVNQASSTLQGRQTLKRSLEVTETVYSISFYNQVMNLALVMIFSAVEATVSDIFARTLIMDATHLTAYGVYVTVYPLWLVYRLPKLRPGTQVVPVVLADTQSTRIGHLLNSWETAYNARPVSSVYRHQNRFSK